MSPLPVCSRIGLLAPGAAGTVGTGSGGYAADRQADRQWRWVAGAQNGEVV